MFVRFSLVNGVVFIKSFKIISAEDVSVCRKSCLKTVHNSLPKELTRESLPSSNQY